MNKLEFGDINKFLTSLGLIFIALAFFLPWFVSQNNSILLIEKNQIQNFTLTAQSIINSQQKVLQQVNDVIIPISIMLIVFGVLSLSVGIYRWWNRQDVLDEIQNEELIAKRFQNISYVEKRNTIENEIESNDVKSNLSTDEKQLESTDTSIINQRVETYLKFENIIYSQLSQRFKNNFIPSQNVRINDIDYDIVFKSKRAEVKDRIVEIKYFDTFLNYESIKFSVDKLFNSTSQYQNLFRRAAISLLVVIYSQNEYSETPLKFKRDLEDYAKTMRKSLRVIFISETDLLQGKDVKIF